MRPFIAAPLALVLALAGSAAHASMVSAPSVGSTPHGPGHTLVLGPTTSSPSTTSVVAGTTSAAPKMRKRMVFAAPARSPVAARATPRSRIARTCSTGNRSP